MDLREKKTRKNITNAFLQLRRKKPLERITVKELSELAEISKATFYLHYKDIYDLSEQLQNQVIQNILDKIAHQESCLTDPKGFTEELFYAFHTEQNLIETLFSGNQSQILTRCIEEELCALLRRKKPDLNRETEMLLTYSIQGAYAVYQKYCKTCSFEELLRLVSAASERVVPLYGI